MKYAPKINGGRLTDVGNILLYRKRGKIQIGSRKRRNTVGQLTMIVRFGRTKHVFNECI